MRIMYDPATGLPLADGLPPKLDIDQASKFFGLEKKTLQRMASQHVGPPCYRLHRRLQYPTAAGAEWLKNQIVWKNKQTDNQ